MKKQGSGFFDGIQVIYQNKDEESSRREVDLVGIILCVRKISSYIKEEHYGGSRRRKFGI